MQSFLIGDNMTFFEKTIDIIGSNGYNIKADLLSLCANSSAG